jgi:hypothetical protein
MPSQEGGYAPNYTPTALTDGESGIILDANVLDVVNESGEALPAVDRVTELCGEAPENFLSDGGNASGGDSGGHGRTWDQRRRPGEIDGAGRGQPGAAGRPDATGSRRSVGAAGEEFSGPTRQIELHLRSRAKRLPLP